MRGAGPPAMLLKLQCRSKQLMAKFLKFPLGKLQIENQAAGTHPTHHNTLSPQVELQ
jgi:hypothetical protein